MTLDHTHFITYVYKINMQSGDLLSTKRRKIKWFFKLQEILTIY